MSSFGRSLVRLFGRVHHAFYRGSGGRVLGGFRRVRFLLLTTTGRKTGKKRTTPLLYIEDRDGYAVVASFAGSPKHPAWYLNLERHPEATVQIGDQVFAVAASTATLEEKRRLWPRFTAVYPDYDAYQKRTDRQIPVVLLRKT